MTSQVEPQVKPHNVKEIVALLAEQFPLCFSLTGEAKPLKIGIFQDLVARLQDNPLFSKTQLRQALRVYTSSWRYLDAVKAGIARIDLEGIAGDLVDEQQAEHAAKTLVESKAKAAEVRKAKALEHKARQQQQKPQADASQPATTDVAKTDKPAYKKNAPRTAAKPAKSSTLKENRPAKVATPVVAEKALQAVTTVDLVVGAKVLIKLGQNPMPATVVEVVKQDVVVQLASGMVVKTHSGSLYQA
ncbi:RNA chaperone ProQ [Rheinheimera riviphila]|uniref:RNA chaperone ProQ n=1 Tax=Rheinheimera riviphila TaxID=1834037 RepID=A0A437R268_9GAMM|nr:RNA chaperone ProQ [Rheinheimera riviphila]RVU40841.1 RNA chaperone ProQ [Rheinheimera riviphila]